MDEYINFEMIRDCIKINGKNIFFSYLKDVFKDLSERSENKKLGISKITFYNYYKIPVFIAEKLFMSLDKDEDGYINLKEFTEGMLSLYLGSFEECVQSIFDIYDFDKDGEILIGDVKVILSYLPLRDETNGSKYKYQMESQNEIDDILKKTFGKKNKLNFKEFLLITEKTKSDIFIQLLCFLIEKRPFLDENVNIYKKTKNQSPESTHQSSPKRNLPSPSRKSLLSPVENLIGSALDRKSSGKKVTGVEGPEKSGQKGMIRMANKLIVSNIDNQIISQSNQFNKIINPELEKLIKSSQITFDSPSTFLKGKKEFVKLSSEFNLEESLVKLNNFDLDDDTEYTENEPAKKNYENLVYKITEKGNLKSYWLMCQGTDIYYYKDEKKDNLQGMHSLTGCFVKETGERTIDNVKYYSFSIMFPSKVRNYYTKEKHITRDFVNSIMQGSSHQCFFDFYEMRDTIGEGKFGLVKLGIHRKTHEKVAIKIIKKESMTKEDNELVHFEIDIMKLCRHENVVTLLDHFENDEYIFIIMEFLSGGDLGSYLHKCDFKVTEEFASHLVFQIASGLKYLHSFGILHRDLKPENIMLSSKNDKCPRIKIMDFGLSKILGPNERLADGFGTLSFVAPEVLIRQPYNKQIDIWSLGVILYYSLSGTLPFDDENDNEEVIAKMTVFEEVEFPSKIWKTKSLIVIDLIKKTLIKNPDQRITIDGFLNHEWVRKYNKSV